jgi:GTPase SAR1 family protein
MEFISFKKIIIFGSEGTGKSTLTSRFDNKYFKEENPSNSCNYIFYN